MCGIAGRMLMELGVHNEEAWSRLANSQSLRSELCTLVSSIVILDRQWSAAANLPSNFHDSSFSPVNLISVSYIVLTKLSTCINPQKGRSSLHPSNVILHPRQQ